MRTRRFVLALALLLASGAASAAPKRALFDNTHQETAGNADWIIDTDQPLPLPDQSTVTAATPRTYWLGGISSYGIDLVKRGYFVATLVNSPGDSALGITYNNPANKYDLSKFDVFIIPEPNTRFTAAESTAIFDYVRDGGGLIAISDHWNSDRNGDGADSPEIFDYLDRQRLFGIHADTIGEANNNIVQDSGNENPAASDSIIHGPNGFADSLSFHNGTTYVLYPAINPTVRGEFWMTGTAPGSTTNVMAASAVYGNGRVFHIGDSSPVDDGSAQPGNSSIFDGWGEAAGRDSILFINATIWATRRSGTSGVDPPVAPGVRLERPRPNPSRGDVTLAFSTSVAGPVRLEVFDLEGRRVWAWEDHSMAAGPGVLTWSGRGEPTGLYFVRLTTPAGSASTRLLRLQ